MLHELRIRNLLLIDLLEVELKPGFNVMTGETGAGKSVLVGALQLILGGRSTPDLIRPGAKGAEVEARFRLAPQQIAAISQLSDSDEDELVIRRVISPSSRSRAYLNGRLAAVSQLGTAAPHLADIASQHESVSLTRAASHIDYLDAFGGLESPRQRVADLVQELHDLRRRIAKLRELDKSRAERIDFLEFQLATIEDVRPQPDEMDSLKAERSRLRNAGRLRDTVGHAGRRLVGDDGGVCDQLRQIAGDLDSAAELDTGLTDSADTTRSALEQLLDVGRTLDRYVEGIDDEPGRLDEVEQRLYQLEQLLRRHGPTLQDVLDAAGRLRAELESLDRVDEELSQAEETFRKALRRAGKHAFELSRKRVAAAKNLADGIGRELAALGMGGARVLVEVERHGGEDGDLVVDGAKLRGDGIDRVEFLIAPNKGIAPRPLRKIASGGELSRSLLAIKRILASQGPAGLYVFDEVDAGVGGAVAERIGQALADIAKHHQVLCITHLAPIAALADAHFVVRKNQAGDVARTDLVKVTGQDRVREVARMLSGKKITQASLDAASEMIAGGGKKA